MEKIPFVTYILFIIGFLFYIFSSFLIEGKLFNLYSKNDFNYEYYKKFWKDMTSVQRLFFSETYYQFLFNFTKELNRIKEGNSNKNIEMVITNITGNHINEYIKYLHVPSFLVSLIPKDSKKKISKKLLICSHFDGHNLTEGGTAYDDAINVVSMLGTIDALIKKNEKLDTQVDFLFDGAEEYGLVGAHIYADYLNKSKNESQKNEDYEYDYFNLEAMGGAPPFGFVIKSKNGNYRIQKALSKTRGSILLASNYIYATKFTSSSTDHVVFDEQKWRGGVSVFLGKGSVYHTKYDRIDKEEHLKIAGNQLLDFVLNYKSEGYNGDSIGYGIAPICIVLPILVMYITVPIIFLLSVAVIIYKERESIKLFLQDLLKEFLSFIIILCIFLIQGLLISFINSNSASANKVFVILSSFSGLFLFLLFQQIFNIKKWSRFRLILDSLIMIIFITTDLSVPFSLLTIFSILFYFFDNKIAKFIFGILQVLVMSLFFAFLLDVFMQYTVRFSDLLGNLVIFLFYFVFSYHISVSPLEFNEIDETKNICELVKDAFDAFKDKNEVEDKFKLLNSDNLNYNINDDINNNEVKKKAFINKFCNKKGIPLYLLIIYILYPLILLISLFLKSYPYSKNYTINGLFMQLIRDNNNSSLIFAPNKGYNYAKKNIKKSKFSKKFKEEKLKKYIDFGLDQKVFIYETNDTKIKSYYKTCNDVKPELNFSKIISWKNNSDGTYDFIFDFKIQNHSCIDSIYISIFCDDCIKKTNGKELIIDEKDKNNPIHFFDVLLKVGKEIIYDDNLPNFNIDTNFTLSTSSFKYMVLLNTMKNTETYQEFLNSFGEAACNMKSAIPSDTLYKYDGEFSIKN